jgi:hypothetical protein
MTTLREWLDRLKTFDPDDWGDIEQLRASFSEEELGGDLEAEIAFDTVGGPVDHVVIRLIDNSQDIIVDPTRCATRWKQGAQRREVEASIFSPFRLTTLISSGILLSS